MRLVSVVSIGRQQLLAPSLLRRRQAAVNKAKIALGIRPRLALTVRAGTGPSTYHARQQTLNRYGIPTYDLGTRYLQQGCVGDDVAQLQALLRAEGCMKGEDAYPGYFGTATEAAVVKWQKKVNLPPTGGFGDLARETYLQKQELKLQHQLATLPVQEPAGLEVPPVRPAEVASSAVGSVVPAGRLAAGLLLAAALLVGWVQGLGWWRRRQTNAMYEEGWYAEEGSQDPYAEYGAANLRPPSAGLEGDVVAVQSPYGTYFVPAGMAGEQEEYSYAPPAPAVQRAVEREPRRVTSPPRPRPAERQEREAQPRAPGPVPPGSYFGGAIKRPQYGPGSQRAAAPWDVSPTRPTNQSGAEQPAAPKPGAGVATAGGSSGWDSFASAFHQGTADAGVAERSEEGVGNARSDGDEAAASGAAALAGSPGSSSRVGREGMTWEEARGTAVEPRRPGYDADELKAYTRRLTSRQPGDKQASGEIWVGSVRVSADGEPVPPPSFMPAAELPRQPQPASPAGPPEAPRRRPGRDYKMVRGNEEVVLARPGPSARSPSAPAGGPAAAPTDSTGARAGEREGGGGKEAALNGSGPEKPLSL